MNNLKAFVRIDSTHRVIAGSNIFRQNKPTIGKWEEIPAYNKCCSRPVPPPPIGGLIITFNSIPKANLLIGGSTSDVNVWNLFFELSNDNQYGSSGGVGKPFTSVMVDENVVHLYGGSGITLLAYLFSNDEEYGCLVSIDDTIECITQIRDGAFMAKGPSCPSLISVNFPGVIWMQPCFDSCQALTTVNIPQVTYLGQNCFGNCTSLISINLPQVTYLGQNCFGDCTSLTTVNLPSLTTAGIICFSNCTSLTTVDLPSLTTAGNGCFYYCTSLTTVDLPLLTTAGVEYFSNCTSLTTVDLPLLTTAGNGCFYNCTSLTTVYLPSLTTAGESCFSSCINLTTINAPLLETAGDWCFYYCTNLISLNFPSLQTIGGACFSDCTNLISIDFPLLSVIAANSFQKCYNLISINIPNCQYLGTGGFNGTSGALVLCPEYNYVFAEITGNTITLTIPYYFMSNWDVPAPESPDGDVQYLQANNNVTIIYSNPI